MKKVSVRALPVEGKKVFVRVDFNVPLDQTGRITDDYRIKAALPTILHLLQREATVVLGSHLGKPKGKFDPKLSLKPVACHLENLLQREVIFLPDCIGPEVVKSLLTVPKGSVVLLENLRFHPEEEKNEPSFAKALASLVDFYVNDAFSASHRSHASIVGMPQFFATPSCGLLMEKELEYLTKVTEHPERPFVVIIGGAKISDKVGVITNLLPKVDYLLIGGGVAFNFLKARGYSIGKSIYQPELLKTVEKIKDDKKIILPVDLVVAKDEAGEKKRTVKAGDISEEEIGFDIGEETVKLFTGIIDSAKTVVWTGPMGVFEKEPYSQGTKSIAQKLGEVTKHSTLTLVGGGDTVAAVRKFGYEDRVSYISTGGGATLEFLSGRILPGLAALTEAK